MKARLLPAIIFLGLLPAAYADKPTAYDHITAAGASIDRQVNAVLAPKYTIITIEDSPTYMESRATAGGIPPAPKLASGETLTGYVLVAYVVTREGRAVDPVILKTTDERLSAVAISAMADWRFEPAKLNGSAIATTAAQEFNFKDAAPLKGFATDNIVLYQPNEVLIQRLPGPDQLAAYIKQLQAVLSDFFADARTPENLNIVVAVRPGNVARVWFISSTRSGHGKELDSLRQKLEAIEAVDVRRGPIAFAISGSIAGGHDNNARADKNFQLPIPLEWQAAAKGLPTPILVPDGYLDVIWPAKK